VELRIISCEKLVFSGEVLAVYAKSPVGWFGILPGHAPAMFFLSESPLRVQLSGEEKTFFVRNGVLQVRENRLTLVAEEIRHG